MEGWAWAAHLLTISTHLLLRRHLHLTKPLLLHTAHTSTSHHLLQRLLLHLRRRPLLRRLLRRERIRLLPAHLRHPTHRRRLLR